MRHLLLLGVVGVAGAVAFACSSSSSDEETPSDADAGDEGGVVVPPPSVGDGGGPVGPAGSGLNTGLPCDVQALLENRCIACHDGKTAVAMLSYDDLMKPSATDPAKSIAVVALARMKDAASPMPPKPAEPADKDEIAIMEDWVKAGTPKGAACTDPPPADGGAPLDAGDGGVVCSSGTTWTAGDLSSPLMHPGMACNACHQVKGGPNLTIAGTLYPTAHEPDDCYGKAPPPSYEIVITDARNRTFRVPVNSTGNFSTRSKLRAPFKAAVTDGTNVRVMLGSVTSGDCNSCHSVQGKNGAPGRIVVP